MSMFTYVNGETQLQKFGMMSFYEVLRSNDFFDDWQADKYGGFSPRLASSLRRLEKYGYVRSYEIIKEYHTVKRYSLTDKGLQSIDGFLKTNASKIKDMRRILQYYYSLPLPNLLDDVYQKYTHLTIKSKIKSDKSKAAYMDIHTRRKPDGLSKFVAKKQVMQASPLVNQHVFGDMEFRKQLAKSIGLDAVPDLDPESFDRIKGILSERIGMEDFDAVDAVREARNW